MTQIKLRPYQKEDSKKIIESWKDNKYVLYQLPTGGGKTVVINDVIKKILKGKVNPPKGKKILILVHRREIIFQIRKRLQDEGIKTGLLIGNLEEDLDADILVGSILTVARDKRLQGILDNNYDYLIIDEAHHTLSNSYIKFINSFKEHNKEGKILGVTATPHRMDKKELKDVFEILIQGLTYGELRKQGYLTDYITYIVDLKTLDNEVEKNSNDYNLTSLSKYMRREDVINKAVDLYEEKGQNKQMLIFTVDKEHAKDVMEVYKERGHNSIALITSDTDNEERKNYIKKYEEGKLKIIVSIQTLTEGVDLPDTGVIQLLRPTLSLVLYLQMLGRGTRIKNDGEPLIILDVSQGTIKHGFLDSNFSWNLEGRDPKTKVNSRRLVGVRENGEFTEDLEEIEKLKLEVKHLTNQEYIEKVIQNLDKAEKFNNEIEEKNNKLVQEFKEFLNKIINNKNIVIKDELGWNFRFSFDYKGNYLFNINYNEKLKLSKIEFSYRMDKIINSEKINEGKQILNILLKLNSKKVFNKLQELYNKIQENNEGKVDINLLKDKIKVSNRLKTESLLNEKIQNKDFIIEILEEKGISSYNFNIRDLYSNVYKIKLYGEPRKLNKNIKVEFYNVEGRNASSLGNKVKNIKKELLINILNEIEWK